MVILLLCLHTGSNRAICREEGVYKYHRHQALSPPLWADVEEDTRHFSLNSSTDNLDVPRMFLERLLNGLGPLTWKL